MAARLNRRKAIKRVLITAISGWALVGCGSTPPTKIGADTFYSSRVNAGGAFGNPGAIAGDLMAEGNAHCASLSKEFELVTQNIQQPAYGQSLGGASITFKCVDKAGNPTMRPDRGVTTIERR